MIISDVFGQNSNRINPGEPFAVVESVCIEYFDLKYGQTFWG